MRGVEKGRKEVKVKEERERKEKIKVKKVSK